jgi:tubulin polyglutamylase TTLL9
VNASPSLSAETQFDYDLKYAVINDAMNVIDVEKKYNFFIQARYRQNKG